ncbi:FAD-dependent monooxygenase [Streptomyces massasporeus]|uniref:FAD-dependent monooxygenase n=1 Tax=Streptomyces massasporeus TaxID=67324 RepID=UPI00381E25B9
MGRLLVIGGGAAGTAAALALHKAGFDVTVHEAHPDAAEDIGAFLTLASNGMRALAQIDAAAAVTALGFPLTGMRMLDGSGTQRAARPLGEAEDPALRFRCLRRGDLNTALQAEAARRGIPVRHGARLVSVHEGPDSVTAHFADGATATADLLIGADGLNSTVRRWIAPSARPRYAGERVFYGRTTDAPRLGATDVITFIRGTSVAFGHTASPEGETYWFARVAGDPLVPEEIARGTADRHRDFLVPLLREDATPAAGIVAATAEDILVTNAAELPRGMPWRSARCLLVGDAAHAASPATGQASSMALEDAVILAKALRDAPDPDTALTTYENLRRPRVEHNITVSGGISRGAHTRPAAPAPRPGDEDLIAQLEWGGR